MADDLNVHVSDSVNVQDSADVQRTWLDLQTGILHVGDQQQIDLADYVEPDKLDQLLADVRQAKSLVSALWQSVNPRDRRARSTVNRRVTIVLALNQMLETQTNGFWQNEREFYDQLVLSGQYTKTTVQDSYSYKTFKRDVQAIEKYASDWIYDPVWLEYRIRKIE